ncbi:hypothetical protein G9A89_002192 [Geosiphon pyriformis]|nr:hypothetical protein G9A89_002192 [Geosiphon pyriformis]
MACLHSKLQKLCLTELKLAIDESVKTGEKRKGKIAITAFKPKIPILVHHNRLQSIKDKLKLYTDVWSGKDANEYEDEKLRKAVIWGERKFMRTVICLGMLVQGIASGWLCSCSLY